jgi:hypothetical protein
LKKVIVVFGFIKKYNGFASILAFSRISRNCYCIGKVMDRVYESWDHDWLSVHGGLATMGQRGRSRAREVIVIAWREREEVIRVITNGVTWRQSC